MTRKKSSIVRPVDVDGIELYTTDYGSGMSQSGLARFVGVTEGQIRALFQSIQSGKIPELDQLVGQDFFIPVKGHQNAKVVRSGVCADVCAYYAYEAPVTTKEAKYSLKRFATIGLDNWIRNLVFDHDGADGLPDVTELIQRNIRLQQELLEEKNATIALQRSALETERYLREATGDLPGLQKIMEGRQKKQLPPKITNHKSGEFTLREWLAYKGVSVPESFVRKLRQRMSTTSSSLRAQESNKQARVSAGGNNIKAVVYNASHLAEMQQCFDHVMAEFTAESEGGNEAA